MITVYRNGKYIDEQGSPTEKSIVFDISFSGRSSKNVPKPSENDPQTSPEHPQSRGCFEICEKKLDNKVHT